MLIRVCGEKTNANGIETNLLAAIVPQYIEVIVAPNCTDNSRLLTLNRDK